MTDIPSLVESVPACNCSGADDGAWGLASHASNCATIVARLRRFHVGHQIASGKGEVICMTCHMELLSTQDDALADARYELTRLRAELETERRKVEVAMDALRANQVFHTPIALSRKLDRQWDEYEADAINRTKAALTPSEKGEG